MKRIGEKGKSMYRAMLRAGLTLAITFLLGASCPSPKVTEAKNDKEPLVSKKKADAANRNTSELTKKDCKGWAVYGPPPCHSDEDCVKREGEGWYCNTEHYYTDPCGEKHYWPLCEPKKEEPKKEEPKKDAPKKDCSDWSKDLPPACHSQEDCVKSHGHGWFCSDQNRVTDACGEEHVWPQCKPIR